MKRGLFSIFLIFTLVLTVFTGCTKTEVKTEAPKPAEQAQPQPAAEPVTITYANWNLGTPEENNLERQMIKAFEESHPNVKIQIADTIDYGKYEDSLTAAAAAGKLPDVFMLTRIPFALSNDWLYNISEFTASDSDWANLPKPLEQATHYGSGVYAVPAGMFFFGYYVNDDIFTKANVQPLSFSPTWDQFMAAVKATNNPKDGIVGLAEEVQFPEFYPASVNPKLGWYTWDGEKYNLNDPSFVEAIKKARELFQGKYVYDSLTDEQKKQYNAGWFGDVWNQGKIAIRWDGTWSMNDFSKLNFKSRFIGVPGGRIPVVGDFIGISKSAQHPKEAYEFAKFMTFGKDGILKRMELNTSGQWVSLPLTTDKAILDQYFAKNKYEGLKEAFAIVDNGIMEGFKFVPGYIKSRWEAPSGIKVGDKDNANLADVIWDSMRGKTKIEDYVDQINKIANDEYDKEKEKISALVK